MGDFPIYNIAIRCVCVCVCVSPPYHTASSTGVGGMGRGVGGRLTSMHRFLDDGEQRAASDPQWLPSHVKKKP